MLAHFEPILGSKNNPTSLSSIDANDFGRLRLRWVDPAFSFGIVFSGLLDTSMTILMHSSSSGASVLRILRLGRLLRIFKLIRWLRQLYMLAHGFAEAAMAVVLKLKAVHMVRTNRMPESLLKRLHSIS